MELLKYDPSTITGSVVAAMKAEGIPVHDVYAVNLTREEFAALTLEHNGRPPQGFGPLPIFVDGRPLQPSSIMVPEQAAQR